LDKHYASYGGTDSQLCPPADKLAPSQSQYATQVLAEPLLEENPNRFVILPILYKDIWKMYKD
jgi:hypothetical protein